MDAQAIDRLVIEAQSLGRKTLPEPDAKEILRLSGVPVPRSFVAKDLSGAVEIARKIGYPLVLKVVSPDIPHKSDVGGVALGIRNAKELEEKWAEMVLNVADESATSMIEGFLVEEMAPKGAEVIIGAVRDEQFGPLIMFGTGGVAVELMKDVSFRLGPLSKKEAIGMMTEVKGFALLTGYRGETFKDIEAVAEIILMVSHIMEEVGALKELEINPLLVYERGVMAVDARAVLK
ncbi:MAG: hypothetical protein A2X99_01850 [Deltaproteobacteria bacterium GWB2_55_19]|nr:MAG: hypothetical protein A2X99_01850 [Deltaproteobacteria bacterium GWB2_55_19]HAO92572.1 acetyl-CoA synthetase [Deltaproteobacteria bacterium]